MEYSILVVEDSPTQAERLRLLLRGEGYRVTIAANGREGLESVRADPPDLILSDVLMPEVDGFSFCRTVKSLDETKHIPVVLLTTENAPLDIIIGLERGADYFITKPFDPAYLLKTIRQIQVDIHLRREGSVPGDAVLHVGNRQIAVSKDRQQIVELLIALTHGADVTREVNTQRIAAEYGVHMSQLGRIRHALDNDRFVLFYQPVIDVASGRVHQYEVLLRMLGDVDQEVILPAAFIPTAEELGLISQIDLTVLQRSIDLIREHRMRGGALRLAVNVSGKTLSRASVVERMTDILSAAGVDAEALTLEITETAVVNNTEHAIQAIERLRSHGCRFALDDFGVGYSTIDYLRNLPVDSVKIDGSFVRELRHKETDQRLVKAITQMAHDLGKEVVAEFVEDGETLELLRSFGVELAQGYFLGRPGPGPLPVSP